MGGGDGEEMRYLITRVSTDILLFDITTCGYDAAEKRRRRRRRRHRTRLPGIGFRSVQGRGRRVARYKRPAYK